LTSGLIADPQHFAEIAADAVFRTDRPTALPSDERFIEKFAVRHRRVAGCPVATPLSVPARAIDV
jgi:hypothetical protein